MKYTLIAALLVLGMTGTANAQTDYYLEIEGVQGESSSSAAPAREEPTQNSSTGAGTSGNVGAPGTGPQEASVDAYIKLPDIDGESTESSAAGIEPDEIDVAASGAGGTSGNVNAPGSGPQEVSADFYLKLPDIKGESEGRAAGVEPDEIDFMSDSALTPDFGILFGGGNDGEAEGGVQVAAGDVNGYSEEQRAAIAQVLLAGMQEEGAPAEQMSLNFEKIKVTYSQQLKVLGFIPATASVDVEVDGEAEITLKYPWWAFLASGKDETLGQKVLNTLTNVLKSRHDAVMAAIQNTR